MKFEGRGIFCLPVLLGDASQRMEEGFIRQERDFPTEEDAMPLTSKKRTLG